MINGSEGMPRSGKSYDAMKNHILPALKAGRQVYARINLQPGSHQAIAKLLELELERVQELLVHVASKDVVDEFKCDQDESGEWVLRDRHRGALVVVDEVHEFYQTGEKMPVDQKSFFAMAGHYGTDILVMSQSWKDINAGIRRRVERKASFQKMTALGSTTRYQATRYNAIAPERYEKLGTQIHSYEPAIFPCYQGFKDDAPTEVYEGGKVSAYRQLLWPALIVVPLGLAGIYFVLDFFNGGAEEAFKGKKRAPTVATVQMVSLDESALAKAPAVAAPGSAGASAAAAPGQGKAKPAAADPLAGLTQEQRYVFDLSATARPRLAMQFTRGELQRVVVEWRDLQNVVLELLDADELDALGVTVYVTGYGARLVAGDQSMIVTRWPVNAPVRESEPRLYNLSGDQAPGATFGPIGVQAAPGQAPSSGGAEPRIGSNYAFPR
jgi:zona occludens toxin